MRPMPDGTCSGGIGLMNYGGVGEIISPTKNSYSYSIGERNLEQAILSVSSHQAKPSLFRFS